MGENTSIAWATHTHNPWIGCTKVSPACTNCYAESYGRRFGVEWGPGKPRRRTSEANWRKPLAWNRKAEEEQNRYEHSGALPDRAPQRPRVFCGSLCDWLDPAVPVEWLADLLALMAATPHLDWQLLTKRPQLWRERIDAVMGLGPSPEGHLAHLWLNDTPPDNVWVGTTVEDQQRADERIPELLRIPARVRFLSCEPLLGPVALDDLVTVEPSGVELHRSALDCDVDPADDEDWNGANVHWVICGGESGPNARPMHPSWARSLRDQCQAAGVPFLFKQWGEWVHARQLPREERYDDLVTYCRYISDGAAVPCTAYRVGKKAAGRELDGKTWDEFPEVTR